MLKKTLFVLVLALALVGSANAAEMILDQTYEGPYWMVAEDTTGATQFGSVQAGEFAADGPDLQAVAIEWSQSRDGVITGSANFLSVNNKGTMKVQLDGFSPEPARGQNYREAIVNVTFVGGTGVYEGATGKAEVTARLTPDGISRGRITGTINVPGL